MVAHSNSLRALAAHLGSLCAPELLDLDIPTGMPLGYQLDRSLAPVRHVGHYLEPVATTQAAAPAARQGDAGHASS